METVSVVELSTYLSEREQGLAPSAAVLDICKEVARILSETGIVIVRDPRVNEQQNNTFLDLMEDYFSQPTEVKLLDARPEIGYQLGVTPDHVEEPRCVNDPQCITDVEKLTPENRPHFPTGPDVKWRYFWRIGARPVDTKFPEQNHNPVIPANFAQWETTMNQWGQMMHHASTTLLEMLAIGLGLPPNTFTSYGELGPHLLAPTASDLSKYAIKDTIFAGYHYDLNFVSTHGKSRFPGLYVWKRDGTKLQVKVPEGCLLIQAAKQLEWLTGGLIRAGMHEVVVDNNTLEAVERQKARGRPLWRISSTFFYHVASDKVMQPLEALKPSPAAIQVYYPIAAGDHVLREIEFIKLKTTKMEE